MGANGGAGTANPSGTIEIITDFVWDTRSSMFSFLYGAIKVLLILPIANTYRSNRHQGTVDLSYSQYIQVKQTSRYC